MLFFDAPVGGGFSYATISKAWSTSDTKVAAQAYEFLRNVSVIDGESQLKCLIVTFNKILWLCKHYSSK